MRIPLETQRTVFDRHAEESARQLTQLLSEIGPELIELARARAFRDVGVHEYGDKTYWLSADRLREELLAELADAVFYLQIQVARDNGDLPSPE